jgi:phosphoribosylaminoimidazolecarboxamide formyltransferase/IMP cyclohydrolase
VEAVIAPGLDGEAKKTLAAKKNLRVMDMDTTGIHRVTGFDLRRVMGGILAQEWDLHPAGPVEVRGGEQAPADRGRMEGAPPGVDGGQARQVQRHRLRQRRADVGVGAGQMSSVDAARFAALKAKLPLAGTAAASDAFFPFRDGVDEIAKAGAVAVIQPGGSVKDEEVIAAADEHKMAMVFTGVRHFRH